MDAGALLAPCNRDGQGREQRKKKKTLQDTYVGNVLVHGFIEEQHMLFDVKALSKRLCCKECQFVLKKGKKKREYDQDELAKCTWPGV